MANKQDIVWKLVKNGGIGFSFAKATGGRTYMDPQFENNWNGMREAGLIRGAYHFFSLTMTSKSRRKISSGPCRKTP